jgi:hypothetical protein
LKDNKARIPAYVDSTYFRVFNHTLQGIAEGAGDTNVADISRGLRMDGAQARLALTALSPAELLMEPLHNPTRRLCQLRRARRFCADHPADTADGRGNPNLTSPIRALWGT